MLYRIVLLAFSIMFWGCGFLKEPGTPLAKVKDQTLTLEELVSRGEVSRDSVMMRVREWVDQQVLMQEALAMGVQNEPEVRWLLRDAERKILLDAFIHKFEKKIADPEEGELELFFGKHRENFLREEPGYGFQEMQFTSVIEAKNALRKQDSLFLQDSVTWKNSSALNSCYRGILSTLRPGQISVPQLCSGKAVLLKLVQMKSVGDSLSYQESRNRILLAVRRNHRNQKLDSLLLEAKSRQAIFTWPENLPLK